MKWGTACMRSMPPVKLYRKTTGIVKSPAKHLNKLVSNFATFMFSTAGICLENYKAEPGKNSNTLKKNLHLFSHPVVHGYRDNSDWCLAIPFASILTDQNIDQTNIAVQLILIKKGPSFILIFPSDNYRSYIAWATSCYNILLRKLTMSCSVPENMSTLASKIQWLEQRMTEMEQRSNQGIKRGTFTSQDPHKDVLQEFAIFQSVLWRQSCAISLVVVLFPSELHDLMYYLFFFQFIIRFTLNSHLLWRVLRMVDQSCSQT